jgi:hypothetical protein
MQQNQNVSQNVANFFSKFGEFYPSKIEIIYFPHIIIVRKFAPKKKTALGPNRLKYYHAFFHDARL